jgi:hypothetical protein
MDTRTCPDTGRRRRPVPNDILKIRQADVVAVVIPGKRPPVLGNSPLRCDPFPLVTHMPRQTPG